jgi:ankyrin repeat protein
MLTSTWSRVPTWRQCNNYQISLHIASENSRLDIVKYLVDQGVNMEAVDNEDSTSLHYAAMNGHLDVVKYLVEQGDLKKAMDDDNVTSLRYAATNDHLDLDAITRSMEIQIVLHTPVRLIFNWNSV